MQVITGKLLAIPVAIIFISAVSIAHGKLDSDVAAFAIVLLGALALIWFGNALGGYVGPIFDDGHISRQTPGCVVVGLGWFVMIALAALWLWFEFRGE